MSQPLRLFTITADVRQRGEDEWIVGQVFVLSAPHSSSARFIALELVERCGVDVQNLVVTERP